jgi:serine/threonine protein kinase
MQNAIPNKPANIVVPATPAVQVADVKDKYDLHDQEEKGKGAFSRVVVGHHRESGQPRAIKIMERSILTGKKADMVAHEKEILRRTQHDSIIYLHECLTTQDRVFMVMDLMEGDLFDYIVKRKKLAEVDAATIMKQLLSSVAYLHSISVIHRDIKPENILVSDKGDGKIQIKLADFGLAKVLEAWNVNSTPCGTSFYIAPEIIRGIETNGARPLCTNREEVKFVDIWSCGVVLFVMLAGRPPFYGQVKTREERRNLLAKIDRGLLFPDAQWANVSEDAKDLCQKLLSQEPSGRITAAAALSHPFLSRATDVKDAKPAQDVEPSTPATNEDVAALAAGLNDITVDMRQVGDADGDETSSYNVKTAAAAPAHAPGKKVVMSKLPVPPGKK